MDDLISRQAVLELVGNYDLSMGQVVKAIHALPSVTPKEKTGVWIETYSEIDAKYSRHSYKCSECGEFASYFVGGSEDWWDLVKANYCPNCGARMVKP